MPKADSNAQRLLESREDIFPDYDINNFEREFRRHFKIVSKKEVEGTCRTIYLMEKNHNKPESSVMAAQSDSRD